MMEYLAFDFAPFGFLKTLYNLEDFYHFVDCEFDFKMFDDVITICMRDIVKGLEFLHGIEIAIVVKTVHERFLCYNGDRSINFMRILFYYCARMRVAYWALNYEFYSGYICSLIILRVFLFYCDWKHCDMFEITSSVVIGDKT